MHQRRRRARVLALLALLVACGRQDDAPPPGPGSVRISFEDRAEPGAFQREAAAVRDRPGGSEGLWAAVRGLPRPERALVENTENRRKVVVALFAAPGGGPEIRLSDQAAEALGIADAPTLVRITALRREAQIDTTEGRSWPRLPFRRAADPAGVRACPECP